MRIPLNSNVLIWYNCGLWMWRHSTLDDSWLQKWRWHFDKCVDITAPGVYNLNFRQTVIFNMFMSSWMTSLTMRRIPFRLHLLAKKLKYRMNVRSILELKWIENTPTSDRHQRNERITDNQRRLKHMGNWVTACMTWPHVTATGHCPVSMHTRWEKKTLDYDFFYILFIFLFMCSLITWS